MTDNVTPIAPQAECASCKVVVRHEERGDPTKHGPQCRQPEIRMRRVEGQLGELLDAFRELAEAHNEAIREIQNLKRLNNLGADIIEVRRGLHALARHVVAPGRCLAPDGDNGDYCGGCDLCPNCSTFGAFCGSCGVDDVIKGLLNAAVKERNASTPSPEPQTQRSRQLEPGDGLSERSLQSLWGGPGYSSEPHPDSVTGEPAGSEAAGSVHPGEEPGRPG